MVTLQRLCQEEKHKIVKKSNRLTDTPFTDNHFYVNDILYV